MYIFDAKAKLNKTYTKNICFINENSSLFCHSDEVTSSSQVWQGPTPGCCCTAAPNMTKLLRYNQLYIFMFQTVVESLSLCLQTYTRQQL